MQVPYQFIQPNAPTLDWCDLLWGYEHGLIGWSDVVDFAKDRVTDQYDEDVNELAGVGKEADFRVGELLRILAARQGNHDEEKSRRIWLKHVLGWLFYSKDKYADPLAEVETIYADFDYPIEIEGFVRYMPVTDGYDASAHSAEENQQRLYSKWQQYLRS